MSFNDLLKQYQVTPDEPKPAPPPVEAEDPVKANAAPVKPSEPFKPAPDPVRPVNPNLNPVRPVQPTRPVEPVNPVPSPVRPVNPNPSPVRPLQPARPAEPVRPAPTPPRPVNPAPVKPDRPTSDAQQLLDELDQDVRGGAQRAEPVRPLRPGRDNSKRPAARPPRSNPDPARRDLPPCWYIDALLLGVTILALLGILANWNSVMDAAAELIMTLADMAIAAIIVLGIVLFAVLALRRRYRWRRWRRL